MQIEFSVNGKPPRKSQWGTDDALLIIKLREAALDARKNAGIVGYYNDPIKVNLTVYAPNITNVNKKSTGDDDPNKFIGDLDSFVSGVCDYLHKGPKRGENNFEPHPIFNEKPEIGPDVPLIIYDDSQIVEVNARKVEDDTIHYHVQIASV
ncbi:MAG: hypothetical protein IS860_09120 [Nitrosopumilus sp.]|nr:hypothetical protein [Nitrosopumilus sp.]